MSVNILWVAANKWGRHRDIFPHLPPSYLDKWQLLSAASRRWEILHEYAQNMFFDMHKNILRFAQDIFQYAQKDSLVGFPYPTFYCSQLLCNIDKLTIKWNTRDNFVK